MPKIGRRTIKFKNPPSVLESATVAGKVESEGPLGGGYDIRLQEDTLGQKSWEQSEQKLFEKAAKLAMTKAHLSDMDLDLVVGGDLNAQLSSLYMGLKSFQTPIIGVFSACSTITEALTVAGMAIDGGFATRVLVGTSSHNSTAERQFRFPTEYGVQKPPTAQRTVTGAGTVILTETPHGNLRMTHATLGEVVDMGVKSPWEMGAAMAPAAFRTIESHLLESGFAWEDFDCIATGDLGGVGHGLLKEMLTDAGVKADSRLVDCGMMIYNKDQPEVFSGGSGGACCSLVTFSHLFSQLSSGLWKRMLVCATGALLSTVTVQQSQTIPGICHAVVFERV